MNPLLALTETSFDVLLRRSPVALVAFVSATTDMHFPQFSPMLQQLATAYDRTGVLVGRVEYNTELVERFGVDSFPTVLFMDAREVYPYYASEAKPERYRGHHTFEALTEFVEERTDVAPRRSVEPPLPSIVSSPPSAAPPETTADPDDEQRVPSHAPHLLAPHECTELAQAYSQCLRHRRERPHKCKTERHDYLVCMTGRWAVKPEHHKELAALYGREFQLQQVDSRNP